MVLFELALLDEGFQSPLIKVAGEPCNHLVALVRSSVCWLWYLYDYRNSNGPLQQTCLVMPTFWSLILNRLQDGRQGMCSEGWQSVLTQPRMGS